MSERAPPADAAVPRERLVVLSPHLDDAALSVGATIAGRARRGDRVSVLTVLAGDPESAVAAGAWDRAAGFGTAGEAARARRVEDRRACAILGATPSWLPFGDEQYARGDDEAIWSALCAAVEGADAALVPGSPLDHADHAWLARLCLERGLPCGRVGVYVEQPYTWLTDGEPGRVAPPLVDLVPGGLDWRRARHSPADVLAKVRACYAYRSQRSLLGRRRILRCVASDVKRGGEAIAWLAR